MSKRKLRKFIDKKDSVTFHLGYRSQKDPLITDTSAPQRILIPVVNSKEVLQMRDQSKFLKEEQKYGIVFDADYNYLKNLRDINVLTCELEEINALNANIQNFVENKKSKLKLPSSVFESSIEEKVGLSNKLIQDSGLKLDLDSDIIAALDDDFDFNNPDNVLEDNFIELANINNATFNENFSTLYDELSNNLIPISKDNDDVDTFILNQCKFDEIEISSHLSEYSISSNVIKRNKKLIVLDDMFEKFLTDYSENEIGALDYQHIEGHLESKLDVLEVIENCYKDQLKTTENLVELIQSSMKIDNEEKVDSNSQTIIVENREKNNWDCESILTTYNNIYHHPKLLTELKDIGIQSNTKTSKPVFRSELSNHNTSCAELKSESNFVYIHSRPLYESLAQKKDRKLAIKILRKQRRQERKINIGAFKNEKSRQDQISFNEKQNVQGIRIL